MMLFCGKTGREFLDKILINALNSTKLLGRNCPNGRSLLHYNNVII
jgi:hypothetical protein